MTAGVHLPLELTDATEHVKIVDIDRALGIGRTDGEKGAGLETAVTMTEIKKIGIEIPVRLETGREAPAEIVAMAAEVRNQPSPWETKTI